MSKQQKHETILSIKRLVKNQEVSNRPTSRPSGSSNAIGIGKYISDVDFLLSNHYFSCLQKSPRKPGAKIQLCPIRRWCAKNILLDSSSRWKTQKSTNWWSAILISSLSESRMVFNNPSILTPHTWFCLCDEHTSKLTFWESDLSYITGISPAEPV